MFAAIAEPRGGGDQRFADPPAAVQWMDGHVQDVPDVELECDKDVAEQFCAEFGGAAAASMSFTGWSYREDTTAALRSPSGVTLLTRWSDVPAINVDEGGCYSVGSGSIDGIRLTLQSEGEPFGSFDDMGNYVVGVPAPADVTVVWMETGEVPVFLYGDC